MAAQDLAGPCSSHAGHHSRDDYLEVQFKRQIYTRKLEAKFTAGNIDEAGKGISQQDHRGQEADLVCTRQVTMAGCFLHNRIVPAVYKTNKRMKK